MALVECTNALLGRTRLTCLSERFGPLFDPILAAIQNELFDLGADLAIPLSQDTDGPQGYVPIRIKALSITTLETIIDELNAKLSPLNSFILPYGTASACALHEARTMTRLTECEAVELDQSSDGPLNPYCLAYLNRLSDLLFVMARYANDQGKADVLWIPQDKR